MVNDAGVEFSQVGFFVPAAPMAEAAAKANADRPQLLAMLDGLNARYGRGTVRLDSPLPTTLLGGWASWQGQANVFACNVSINRAYWLRIAGEQAARLN